MPMPIGGGVPIEWWGGGVPMPIGGPIGCIWGWYSGGGLPVGVIVAGLMGGPCIGCTEVAIGGLAMLYRGSKAPAAPGTMPMSGGGAWFG